MIKIDHVTRTFGPVTAVDDVGFEVNPGEMVGFLGPNGSGKTTLLRIISTFLRPTRGTVWVEGIDVVRHPLEARKRLAYLPENNILYPRMRVDDTLDFAADVWGLRGAEKKQRLSESIDALHLAPVLAKRNRECSKGFRQRISLAAALIHRPPVILLDEPTLGLDPLQLFLVRDFLRLLAPGRVILFSSHILQEVAAMTQRIVMIHQGKLIRDAHLSGPTTAEQLETLFKESLS